MNLDELLALTASMYGHLRAYKDILETGNCNDCMVRECKYQPQWGQMVRYNCPFYWRGENDK